MEPPIQDHEHEASFLYIVGRVNHGIRREMRAHLASWKLSVQQYTALSVLEGRPGLSNAQLARRAPQPRVLEDGLHWSSPEPALEWARQRASVVMIRMADTDYYSAGRDQPSWRPHAPRWRGKPSGRNE